MQECYLEPDDHMYLDGKYYYYNHNYISFKTPDEDENSKYKFVTEYFENTTRFLIYKKKYNINFIKNIKLLLKKYNIDDLYDKIIDKYKN